MKSCSICQRPFIDSHETCPLDNGHLVPSVGTEPEGLGRVLGSYRLISLLGKGGMGSIFIGAHTRLNRFVAIKVLRKELQHRKEDVARFFDEARTINKLKHPNIVESIDLVEDVIDGAYCVLELLQGPDLKQRMMRGRLSLSSAIHIGAQIGDALSAVHELDIVHRDLKPENLILIRRGGREDFVKLIDFGVAQIEWERASGTPFGTAAYMAPEQAAGERVDGRADVYSLGVLLFEMVTGQHPFPSSSDSEYLLRHADDAPPRPSKLEPRVPKELDALILRCLAKTPEGRFPTAASVAVALRAIDATERRGGRAKWIVLGGLLAGSAAAAGVMFVPEYLDADTDAHAAPVAASLPAPTPDPEPTPDPMPAADPMPAPAAVPEPTAPPTPAPIVEPAEVTITFRSSPSRAQVFRAGETVPLGTTPFSTTFPASDSALEVRFELSGHRSVSSSVALAESHSISETLVPRAKSSSKRTPPPAKVEPPKTTITPTKQPAKSQLHREGTMDPFAPK